MKPTEIAQTENPTEAFAAIYTDSEMMLAWLAAAPTLRDKLDRAFHCAEVARHPRGRFGLESTPEEVQDAIAAFIVEVWKQAEPVRAQIRELRERGLTWGEVYGWLDPALGFSYGRGDSKLLGVADAAWKAGE